MTDQRKDCVAAALSPEQLEQIRREKQEQHDLIKAHNAMKDENGVSIDMLDHAVGIFAEGLLTGQYNIRALLYCVLRDCLKL